MNSTATISFVQAEAIIRNYQRERALGNIASAGAIKLANLDLFEARWNSTHAKFKQDYQNLR